MNIKCYAKYSQNPLINKVTRASRNPTDQNTRWSYISSSDCLTCPVFQVVRKLIDIMLHTEPRQNPLIDKVAKASGNPTNQNARWSFISVSD